MTPFPVPKFRLLLSKHRRALMVVFIFVIFVVAFPFTPGGRQILRLSKEQHQIDVVAPLLKSQKRFAEIHVDIWPANGGELAVEGEVPNMDDLADLRQIVSDALPKTPVLFHVVLRTPTSQPGQSPGGD